MLAVTKRPSKTSLLIALIVLLTLAGIVAIVASSRSKKKVTEPKTEQNPGTPVASNSGQSSGSGSSNTSNTSNQPAANNSTTTSNNQAPSSTLPPPQGTVVSNHNISLSGSDANHNSPAEESTCQTVAGATCVLRITGAQTYTLQPSSSDGKGNFIFDWNAAKIPLTAGDWNVTLIAQQNGHQATSDTQVLHVSK